MVETRGLEPLTSAMRTLRAETRAFWGCWKLGGRAGSTSWHRYALKGVMGGSGATAGEADDAVDGEPAHAEQPEPAGDDGQVDGAGGAQSRERAEEGEDDGGGPGPADVLHGVTCCPRLAMARHRGLLRSGVRDIPSQQGGVGYLEERGSQMFEPGDGSLVVVMQNGAPLMAWMRSWSRLREMPEPLTLEESVERITALLQAFGVEHAIAVLPAHEARPIHALIAQGAATPPGEGPGLNRPALAGAGLRRVG
jgi:hypothetical protein